MKKLSKATIIELIREANSLGQAKIRIAQAAGVSLAAVDQLFRLRLKDVPDEVTFPEGEDNL